MSTMSDTADNASPMLGIDHFVDHSRSAMHTMSRETDDASPMLGIDHFVEGTPLCTSRQVSEYRKMHARVRVSLRVSLRVGASLTKDAPVRGSSHHQGFFSVATASQPQPSHRMLPRSEMVVCLVVVCFLVYRPCKNFTFRGKNVTE